MAHNTEEKAAQPEVGKFVVGTIDDVNVINKKLKEKGIDVDDIITIEQTRGTRTVWYKVVPGLTSCLAISDVDFGHP